MGLPVGVEGGLTILLILDGDFQAWFWGWNTVRSGQQPDASNMTICSGKTQLGARLGFPVDPDPQSHVSVTCASEACTSTAGWLAADVPLLPTLHC